MSETETNSFSKREKSNKVAPETTDVVSCEGDGKVATRKTLLIVAAVSFLAALLLGLIIIIIIVVVLEKRVVEAQNPTDLYTVSFSMERSFTASLNDQTSPEFHLLSKETCSKIKEIYEASSLQESYIGCLINNFSEGSVKVNGTLLFDNRVSVNYEKKQAGSTLTREEYTVLNILETGGQQSIADFVSGSTSIEAAEPPTNLTSLLAKVNTIDNSNNCDRQPCLNGGTCTNGLDTFFCACPSAYTGSTCAQDVTECTSTTCSGNRQCIEVVGGGTACLSDTTNTTTSCQTNINNCSDDPCSYGNCTDLVGNFSCTCEPGYTGQKCDTDIIECGPTTCTGNGECIEMVGVGTRCICYEGYTSADCSQNIDDCIDNPCSYGNCTDLVGNFSCTCEPGYTGQRCDTGIIECGPTTCTGNGECIEMNGVGTRCICYEGYTSADCFQNIDDCIDNPCSYGNCTDLVGNFSCTCEPGYTGQRCDTDIIECGPTTCTGNGECIEMNGVGTRCICYEGYTSADCSQNIDDCIDNPCSYGNCTDLVGNFSCTCEPGYTGQRCDTDIVECEQYTCTANGKCAELVGGGTVCFCDAGWTSPNCSVDVNECALNDLHNCHTDAVCTNTIGGYNCTCGGWFTGDGTTCTDIRICSNCDNTCNVNGLNSAVGQEKTVTSSSEEVGNEITNLVDGDLTTSFRSQSENDPWFMLDLVDIYCVHSVQVIRESEPGIQATASITVGATQADVGTKFVNSCAFVFSQLSLNETYVCNSPISGRFVHLSLLNSNNPYQMKITEVFVHTWASS